MTTSAVTGHTEGLQNITTDLAILEAEGSRCAKWNEASVGCVVCSGKHFRSIAFASVHRVNQVCCSHTLWPQKEASDVSYIQKSAVDLLLKQNRNIIKARVSQPASFGPLVTASCSVLCFTSIHPLFSVRGKSSSFAGEFTSMSKQWVACKSRGWWECQPMKSGGEWDESGATGWAVACFCPLRCVLIPRPFPSVA